jgi:hypothetical protein
LSPNEAEKPENFTKVRDAHNKRYSKLELQRGKRPIKLKKGDKVRLKVADAAFARGFNERWTREYFIIHTIKTRMPIHQYTVSSMDTGEVVEGSFYENELQKITGDVWRIEKVLKRKVVGGRAKLYVKWIGFGNNHNSWIDAKKDVAKIF